MENIDENVNQRDRSIPQMLMRNLVTAIWNNTISNDLSNFLKKSQRFRINSCLEINDHGQNTDRLNSQNNCSLEQGSLLVNIQENPSELIQHNLLHITYLSRNKLAQKELIDDTQIDTSEYDPQPTIKKNLVPIFRTKPMGCKSPPTKNVLNSLVTSVSQKEITILNYSADDSYGIYGDGQEVGEDKEIHKMHMIQSLQALEYLKGINVPKFEELKDKLVFLPRQREGRKTLIFDMDETLIHWVDNIEEENPQFIIKVMIDGEEVDAGINVRPYALECLEAVNQKFEVVVFTASHQTYADAVLDFLDPDRDLIQKRLYRTSWYETEEGIYIKDLRIFANRRMCDLIIVDNAVYSFGFQLNNGIPIIPFYDDPNDEELFHLVPFLEILSTCPDIREKNKEAFQLEQMSKEDLGEFNRIWEVSHYMLPDQMYDSLEYDSNDFANID
jgi:Dullard-like phosphatase family protein